MANDTRTLREHTTEPQDFQLLADDDPIDLTSVNHVEMEMKDKRGTRYSYSTLDSPAYLSILIATQGQVRFSPPTELIFLATGSPYKGYWKIYTTATVHYSCPEDQEFTLLIRETYA